MTKNYQFITENKDLSYNSVTKKYKNAKDLSKDLKKISSKVKGKKKEKLDKLINQLDNCKSNEDYKNVLSKSFGDTFLALVIEYLIRVGFALAVILTVRAILDNM